MATRATIIPPPFASEGGHPQKLIVELLKLVPPHEIFIEPFFGGGSIFWSKPKAKIEIINDINPTLTNFLKWLRRADVKELLSCDLTPSKEKFYEIKSRGVRNICDFIYLNRWSYRGSMKHFALRHRCVDCKPKRLIKLLDTYKERLKDVIIETMDFRDLIKKYKHLDGPMTFWFVNPPYPIYTKERGCKWDVGCGMNPKEVYDAIKDLKGKIMVTESDDPSTRSIFLSEGKFTIKKIVVTENVTLIREKDKKYTKKTQVRHLVLTNY